MIVECGHCGAPLDVREGSRYTRCRYCNKTSEQRMLRTIQPQTPPHWRPPPVWTPPAHVPANSAVPLRYVATAAVAPMIIAILVFVIGGAVAAGAVFSASRKKGPIFGPGAPGGVARTEPAALAEVKLTETPEELQKITGVAMDKNFSMRVPLAHPNWEAVTFRWDKDHLEHVKDFYFNATSSPSTEVRKRLKSLLGRRWGKDGFHWEGCGLYVSEKGDHVGGNVTIEQHGKEQKENPRWQKQAEAMWSLARYGVLDVGDEPSKKALRDYLGLGYALADLSKLDTEADIDKADEAATSVYPGAVRNLSIDLEYKVALDHPFYGEMTIAWKNKKGAKVAEVELWPPPGADNKWSDQAAIDECVTAAFGKPKRVSQGDHLGGSRDTTWNPAGGGSIRVYHHLIVVTLRDSPFSKPMPKDVFLKTVTALEQCGKSAG